MTPLAEYRRFVAHLRTEEGKPLKIRAFQEALLRDHFGSARELVVVIPKKNGKTTLLASLALFHAATTERPEVIIVAASREQAGVMFGQACMLVEGSGTRIRATDVQGRELVKPLYDLGGVRFEVRKGYREIRANGGRIKVLAADADTADGVIPTLALVDELHRHPKGELYDVLMRGIGPRLGRMVTISTAGATLDSPLGRLREKAHAYRPRRITARHLRYAKDGFVLHELALDPEKDDPQNLKHVKMVNPLQTMAELRRMRDTASNTIGSWLRFTCGIWTAGEEPAILPQQWDGLRADIGRVQDGEEVILAPSIGGNAAVTVAAERPDGRVAVKTFHVTPQPDRSTQALTEDLVVALCERYMVLEAHLPEGGFVRSSEMLEMRGVPVVHAHPSPSRLVAASGTFDRLLHERKIIQDGDPQTRAQVLQSLKKVTEVGERYVPGDASRAIGAVVMAVHAATAYAPEPYIGSPSEGVG